MKTDRQKSREKGALLTHAGIMFAALCVLSLLVASAWYFAFLQDAFLLPEGKTPMGFALQIALTMLTIACPLVLLPTCKSVYFVGNRMGIKQGVLFNNRRAFESAQRIKRIFLDKAVVVSGGVPLLRDIVSIASARPEDALQLQSTGSNTALLSHKTQTAPSKESFDRALFDLIGDSSALSALVGGQKDRVLALAASVEAQAQSPLGAALTAEASKRSLALSPVEDFFSRPARGEGAWVLGQAVLVGNRQFMEESFVDLQPAVGVSESLASGNKTVLYVASNRALMGVISLAENLRTNAIDAVKRLQNLDLEVILLADDNEYTALSIAKQLGVQAVFSGAELFDPKLSNPLLSEDKLTEAEPNNKTALAARLQQTAVASKDGATFCLNTLSPTPASAAQQIALINNALTGVSTAVALSKKAHVLKKQNLRIALAYCVVALPLAAGLPYLFGLPLLSPLVAGICITFIVALIFVNTLRLNRCQT